MPNVIKRDQPVSFGSFDFCNTLAAQKLEELEALPPRKRLYRLILSRLQQYCLQAHAQAVTLILVLIRNRSQSFRFLISTKLPPSALQLGISLPAEAKSRLCYQIPYNLQQHHQSMMKPQSSHARTHGVL